MAPSALLFSALPPCRRRKPSLRGRCVGNPAERILCQAVQSFGRGISKRFYAQATSLNRAQDDGGHSLGYRSEANHLKPSDGVVRSAWREGVLRPCCSALRAKCFQAVLCASNLIESCARRQRAFAGLPQRSKSSQAFGQRCASGPAEGVLRPCCSAFRARHFQTVLCASILIES